MFDWLVDEMARIQTRKFHVIDGPLLPSFPLAFEESRVNLRGGMVANRFSLARSDWCD